MPPERISDESLNSNIRWAEKRSAIDPSNNAAQEVYSALKELQEWRKVSEALEETKKQLKFLAQWALE